MFDLWAADDAGFDVYQFRMFCHIARVGVCWKSLRTLATDCNMSLGKASETRAWLADNGYIEQAVDARSGRIGFTITDKVRRSPDEQERSPHEQTQQYCSPDEQECSPHEQSVHHMNTSVHVVNVRNKQEDNNGKEKAEEGDRAPARAEPSPRQRQIAFMVNVLADITAMDGHLNFRQLKTLAEQLLEAYTADQVQAHYAAGQSPNGHWNWYLHDWRGQKGERPSLQAIRETIKAAVSGPLPAARDGPRGARTEAPMLQGFEISEDGTY